MHRLLPVGAVDRGTGSRPVHGLRRALRRRLRARWLAAGAARAAAGTVVDHGHPVRTVEVDRIDHGEHVDRLRREVAAALAAAGITWWPGPADWRDPPLIEVAAEPERAWPALTALDSAAFAISIQVPRRPGLLDRLRGRRLVDAVLGVEFTAFSSRPVGWGPPLVLTGPAPSASEWLLASHETTRDHSRHLGLEAALRLHFVGPVGRPEQRPEGEQATRAPIGFPIDAVYTWVDFTDPEWKRRFSETVRPANLVRAAATESRFDHVNELRYSLRSLNEFAPWVNHIWLVTAGQVPSWLDLGHDRITVITHQQLWDGAPGLPTFNSQAIEAQLHKIPGLSEHFLYFNDDMLLGRPVEPETFFTRDGVPRVFVSTSGVPDGDPDPHDLAPDAAGKNNRRLIADETGTVTSAKYQHAPYALRRSISAQLEDRFGAELEATRRSQFRSLSDVTAAGGLHHGYALATGQAVPGDLRHRYVDLESSNAAHLLDGIVRYRYYEAICLNVVSRGPRDPAALVNFLQSYYPNPAPWERHVGQG